MLGNGVSFIPIFNDLHELIYHNRKSLYFVCLTDMLDLSKFEVNDYIVLSQQFCLSIIDQQRCRISIARALFSALIF